MTVLPATVAVRVVNVGTVGVALIFNVLVAVALLKLVIVPEAVRLTIPLALFVIPVMALVPFRFTVPVLVKLASAVLMAPEPVIAVVPELASVETEQVPPRFKVLVFVKEPAPESAVLTVSVPLLVIVPVTATLGITVVVAPLMVLGVPLKVCTPVFAVKVVAAFARLPA